MSTLPQVKLKALVNFPAKVVGRTGITVTNEAGTYFLDLDSLTTFATQVIVQVDHTNGADIPENGFGAGSLAFRTISYAWLQVQARLKGPSAPPYTTIQVNDAAFTETPPFFVGPSLSGAGPVIIKAGVSPCVWNSAGLLIDDGAVIGLDGFTARTLSSGQNWLIVAKGGICTYQNMIWSSAAGGAHIQIFPGAVCGFDGGTYQVGDAFSAPNCMSYHIQNFGGSLVMPNSGTISLPNALNFSIFYAAGGAGSAILSGTITASGAGSGSGSTGLQYVIKDNATMTTGGFVFPGATSGIFSNGACIDGVASPVYNGIPVTKTGTTGTVGANDASIIVNASGAFTLTLPAAATYVGRWLSIKSIAAQTIVSASANVVPRAGGAAATALLASGAGNWVSLQSDGTNWIAMAGS